MELLSFITKYLSDEFIFGTLKTLKNEYSIVSSMFLFPMLIWLWNKIKRITPWKEPNSINRIEQYEIKPVERK